MKRYRARASTEREHEQQEQLGLLYVGVVSGEADEADEEVPVVQEQLGGLDLGTLANLHDEMHRAEERSLARALAAERIAIAADENVWIPNGAFSAASETDGRERNLTLPLSKEIGTALLANGSPPASPPSSPAGSPPGRRSSSPPDGLARLITPLSVDPATLSGRMQQPATQPGPRWEEYTPARAVPPGPAVARWGDSWVPSGGIGMTRPIVTSLQGYAPRGLPPAPSPAPVPAPAEPPPGPLPLPPPILHISTGASPSSMGTSPSSSASFTPGPPHGAGPSPPAAEALDVTAVRAELDREKGKIAALEEELRSILSHWATRSPADRSGARPERSPTASPPLVGRSRRPRTLLSASLFERAPVTPPDPTSPVAAAAARAFAVGTARTNSPFGAAATLAERLAAILREAPDGRTPERAERGRPAEGAPLVDHGGILPWGSGSSEAESDEESALHVVGPPSKDEAGGPGPGEVIRLPVLTPSPRRGSQRSLGSFPSGGTRTPRSTSDRGLSEPSHSDRDLAAGSPPSPWAGPVAAEPPVRPLWASPLPTWRRRPDPVPAMGPDVGASATYELVGSSPMHDAAGPAAPPPAGPSSSWVRPMRLVPGDDAPSPASSPRGTPEPPPPQVEAALEGGADVEVPPGGASVAWLQEQRARFRQSVLAAERRFMEQLSALKEAQATRSSLGSEGPGLSPPPAAGLAPTSPLLPRVTRESLAPAWGGEAGFGSGSEANDDSDSLPFAPATPERRSSAAPDLPPPHPLDSPGPSRPPHPPRGPSSRRNLASRPQSPSGGPPLSPPMSPALHAPPAPDAEPGRGPPAPPAGSPASRRAGEERTPPRGPGAGEEGWPQTPAGRGAGAVLQPVPELLPSPDSAEFRRQLPALRPAWIPLPREGEEDPFHSAQARGAVMEKLLLVRPTLRLGDLGTDPLSPLFAGPAARVDMRAVFDSLEVAWLRANRGRARVPEAGGSSGPEETLSEGGDEPLALPSGFFDALDL